MDTESLLRSQNARDVRHVVIGATAFPIHGYARATLDVDTFIAAEPDIAARTLDALVEVGYDVTDLGVEDAGLLTTPSWTVDTPDLGVGLWKTGLTVSPEIEGFNTVAQNETGTTDDQYGWGMLACRTIRSFWHGGSSTCTMAGSSAAADRRAVGLA